ELQTLLYDCYRFLLSHHIVIADSALHVYYTALPFTPHDTTVYKTYEHETGQSVRVLQGIDHSWTSCLTSISGSGRIRSVAFSPDGSVLASSSADSMTIILWDAISGLEVGVCVGHTGPIHAVAFSPSGDQLASVAQDNSLRVWDATSGACFSIHPYAITCIAFCPGGEGAQMMTGSKDSTIRVWDTTTLTCTHTLRGHTGPITSVSYHLDRDEFSSSSLDSSVMLWNRNSDTETIRYRVLGKHASGITAVAYSERGAQAFTASLDGTFKMWNTAPLSADERLGHTNWVTCTAFSHEGSRLATGGEDHRVMLWDLDSGSPLQTLDGHTWAVYSLAFSPDGTLLASGSGDCTVRVWDVDTGKLLHTILG
ncbi:WD40-repeat-containing domain protein, partial [Amylostereum chailletii]